MSPFKTKANGLDSELRGETGAALVTVLIFLMAVTLIAGSLLAAATLHLRLARRDLHQSKALYLAQAGLFKSLWRLQGNEGFDWRWRAEQTSLDLGNSDSARIDISERGGFLLVRSSAEVDNQLRQVEALVGQKMLPQFDQAIILGGKDLPLVVTGRNRIVGDVTTGLSGVKTGTIRGVRFQGTTPVAGRIHKVSPLVMPDFDADPMLQSIARMRHLAASADSATFPDLTILRLQGIIDESTLADSLLTPDGDLLIVSAGALYIKGRFSVRNELTVFATGKVEVSDSVNLADALLYSEQEIRVSGAARGKMQLLTPGSIRVSGNSRLTYPSVLFSLAQSDSGAPAVEIQIFDQALVEGTVILQSGTSEAEPLPEACVRVESGARVHGVVYCDGHTAISGTIDGLVVADHFYMYESPTTYINWLKDATIDRRQLRDDFCLPLMFLDQPELRIISWREL